MIKINGSELSRSTEELSATNENQSDVIKPSSNNDETEDDVFESDSNLASEEYEEESLHSTPKKNPSEDTSHIEDVPIPKTPINNEKPKVRYLDSRIMISYCPV